MIIHFNSNFSFFQFASIKINTDPPKTQSSSTNTVLPVYKNRETCIDPKILLRLGYAYEKASYTEQPLSYSVGFNTDLTFDPNDYKSTTSSAPSEKITRLATTATQTDLELSRMNSCGSYLSVATGSDHPEPQHEKVLLESATDSKLPVDRQKCKEDFTTKIDEEGQSIPKKSDPINSWIYAKDFGSKPPSITGNANNCVSTSVTVAMPHHAKNVVTESVSATVRLPKSRSPDENPNKSEKNGQNALVVLQELREELKKMNGDNGGVVLQGSEEKAIMKYEICIFIIHLININKYNSWKILEMYLKYDSNAIYPFFHSNLEINVLLILVTTFIGQMLDATKWNLF